MPEKKGVKKNLRGGKPNNRNNKNSDEEFNPRFKKMRKKVCPMCADKNLILEYKNLDQLRKFITDKGKILPRRASGTCAKHQREVNVAIKRARHIALIPYSQN